MIESAEYTPCNKPRHFQIDDRWEKVKVWMSKIVVEDDNGAHGIGGGFTPTSVGTASEVIWMRGTEKEHLILLTDYASW